jgi:hypothetical protein
MEQREPRRVTELHEERALAPDLSAIDPTQLLRAAADFARDNPHAAIGGALAIGFLLGGGLTPRMLGSLALIAGRRYAADIAREAFSGVVQRELGEDPSAVS